MTTERNRGRAVRFVLRMAVRETRAAWRRLVFFFLCVALGVGTIVALRSVIQSARASLVREARALLAADVAVHTTRPWTGDLRARIDRRVAAHPGLARTETVDTATLARPAEGHAPVARMVELRGVEADYPYYGRVELEGDVPYDHALLRGFGALVRPEVLAQLGVRVGEGLVLGRRTFRIRGVIRAEPGAQIGGFSLGPRVLIDRADLEKTGLLTFGSRATYRILLRVPEPAVDALARALRSDLRGELVRVRSFRSTGEQIGEDLTRAEDYLSLVGFAIVVLGGVGVWSVTRVFIRQKIRSIAILKCLGASASQVLATYLVQVTVLGLAGCAAGVALAIVALRWVPADVVAALGGVTVGLTPGALVQGVGVGLLVSILFALVPLLETRDVRPLLLLRGLGERGGPSRGAWWSDAARLTALGIVAAGLIAVAAWQAGSVRVALWVCGGLAGMAVALHLAGLGLVRAVAPLARRRWFPLRHAVLNVARPGNQTRVILLAVGLGTFFILGARSLERSLLAQLTVQLQGDAPDLFLIDIQPDQVEGVRSVLAAADGVRAAPVLLPVMRARVTGVQGRDVSLDGVEEVRGRGSLGREFVVTWRDRLAPNERIVDGRFWDPDQPADAQLEVSIEEGLQDRAGIQVGDLVRFDVAGRVIEARVTSIREVRWEDSTNGGFMFVFRPGPLARAPHTYLAPVRVSPDPALRAALQHALVVRYPNVSAIDIREILDRLRTVIDGITLAVTIVGSMALAGGLLILIGAVAMTKFQRVYEAAILRTLGATTRMLAAMLALEYGVLGLLAGLAGGAGALLLSWAVARYLFEIPWTPAGDLAAAGALLAAAIVCAVGVAASLDVLRRKPLATLRSE